jgi:predicted RNA polymerase sigma factor
VELNRAVAVSMAFGPEAALGLLEGIVDEPLMRNYHLLPSVHGDLLARLGRHAEAKSQFERAASLTHNLQEKKLLMERASQSARAAGES